MGIKVAKFGGTSLADAAQIRKMQRIVEADPARRYVVPSAPGKRSPDDRKITDLLYLCHENAAQRVPIDDPWTIVAQRYQKIVSELGLTLDLGPALEQTRSRIVEIGAAGGSADFAASRGEYLNGLIVAELLGYTFVDAAEIVRFNESGRLDPERTYEAVGRRLGSLQHAVVPGFYGSMPDGSIKTFSRGGSDISGAIVARGVMAEVYENWTDVSGLLMADPRIVKGPKVIQTITYRELRELAYMGATVLHDEAIFPVRQAGIPVNIRNTNEPDAPGSLIFRGDLSRKPTQFTISGIAGRKDFTVIAIEKAMMNAEIGFGRRVLSALEVNGVSFEHMPSSIDTMSVVVADDQLKGKLDKVVDDIRVECRPDAIEVYPDMALIATVGRGMAHVPGTAAKVFHALAHAGVNVRMIDQGSSEINIIVGVETADFEKAVRSIYDAFVA
jgi:aspartate kinase